MSKNSRARRKARQFAKWKREKQRRNAQKSANKLEASFSDPIQAPAQKFKSGRHTSVFLSEWKITWEGTPKPDRTPEVEQLAQIAYEHIECNEFEIAIELLRKAVELEPDGADLWNNLADALSHSGNRSEAKKIGRMLRERFPDYFFGIIREATQAIHDRNLELARTLLDQVENRKRLHITEFRAIVTCEIELANRELNADGANAWMDIWKSIERHPAQDAIARRIEIHENPWRFFFPGPRRN